MRRRHLVPRTDDAVEAGVAPGDVTDKQLDAIADLADRYSFGEVRNSHNQNIILADVEQGIAILPGGALDQLLAAAFPKDDA